MTTIYIVTSDEIEDRLPLKAFVDPEKAQACVREWSDYQAKAPDFLAFRDRWMEWAKSHPGGDCAVFARAFTIHKLDLVP